LLSSLFSLSSLSFFPSFFLSCFLSFFPSFFLPLLPPPTSSGTLNRRSGS
jgi:hypothetical protein